MILFKKLFIFHFFLLCSNFSLIGQIKVHYQLAKTLVIEGEGQSLNIITNNVPKGATVYVKINEEKFFLKNNEMSFSLNDTSIGLHKIKIEVSSKIKGKTIFKENKEFVFEIAKENVAIETKYGDVVYIGLDNPIKIVANSLSCNQLRVSIFNASLKQVGNCQYILNTNSSTGQINSILTVSKLLEDGGIKVILRKEFTIAHVPKMSFELNKSIDELNNLDTALYLKVTEQAHFNHLFMSEIDSFSCIIFSENKWIEYHLKGSKISAVLLEQFKKLKSKDVVFFDKIFFKRLILPNTPLTGSYCVIKQ